MIQRPYTITTDATHEIEALLVRFERDRGEGPVDLRDYLPPASDPAYAAVVTELARIDMEHASNSGAKPDASKYIECFPDIFADNDYRPALVFEEYRLRRWAGEDAEAAEIANRYGVDASRWPKLSLGPSGGAKAIPKSRTFGKAELAIPVVRYPRVGDTFAGYPLIDRLGEGAFSRVFLARQPDLAGRLVVLKVTPLSTDESDRLARLQHTGIIPVYSVHRNGDLSCICMPFLGATTLADLSPLGERWASLDGPAEELVSTILQRRRSTINMVANSARDLVPHAGQQDSAPSSSADLDHKDTPPCQSDVGELVGLAQYSKLGYVDALLTLVIGAVEGLAHAHQRDVIHRDLKPANILVSDDGNPILLDFNLAVACHEPKTRIVGGTLPYMSPQQLAALETGDVCEASDDVFSLGVILYELLTGHLPFACPRAGEAFDLAQLIEDRRRKPTSIRAFNRGVSFGLEAIINRCFAPERMDRYQDASQLLEDLHRHRRHLPLRFAPNQSLRERCSKWSARHPRISSASSVASLAILLLLLCGVLIVQRGRHIARLDAAAKLQQFQAELPNTVATLSTPGREPEILGDGLNHSSRLLSTWFGDADWKADSGARHLDEPSRQAMRRQLAQLAYLMADAEADLGRQLGDGEESKNSRLQQSLHWNEVASQLDDDLSPLVDQQRQRIAATFAGREYVESSPLALDLRLVDLRTIAAADLCDVPTLLKLTRMQLQQQPANLSLWFYSANAYARLGQWENAIARLNVCDSIQPQSLVTLFNRGLCNLQIGDALSAREDFSACLDIKPAMMTARFNRAVASERLGDLASALRDLDRLASTGRATTRMVLMRARVLQQLGNDEAAAADRARAMTIPPADANDWVARGVSRLADSPRDALDDFLAALRVEPRNFDALQNAAHVYAERLNEPERAIEMLDRLAVAWTNEASPVASRGIMHARLSHVRQAIADAETAAKKVPGPRQQLQIAGIYALLSDRAEENPAIAHEEAKSQALLWLGRALRADPALATTASQDADLLNLRDEASFRRLVVSAMTLQSSGPAPHNPPHAVAQSGNQGPSSKDDDATKSAKNGEMPARVAR